MKFIVHFSPLLYPTVGGFGKDSGGQKLITDPYDMFMPRVKELVSIVAASKTADSVDQRSRKLSKTLFLLKRQTLRLRNHHPLVEWCHHALLAK
jgi:hypothetical protein